MAARMKLVAYTITLQLQPIDSNQGGLQKDFTQCLG